MPTPRNDAAFAWRSPAELAGMADDTPVLLALSGGADSRALLHMLAGDAAAKGYTLTLAHVNHSIRGEESMRDRRFCQSLADAYGLEIVFLDADVPQLAKEHGRGIEEEARDVRYAFFAQLMQERNIPLLATAHHADDLLETLLFRIARGTGVRGMGGILPCRAFGNGFLVRPLLEMTRREILDYCNQNGLQYVNDSTNDDTAYARNRIRKEVVPILESLFAEPQKRAAALAEDLREDDAFLEFLAKERLCQSQTAGGLSMAHLSDAPDPIRRRVLRMWAEETCGAAVQRAQLEALDRLASGETPTARVALPGGIAATVELGVMRTVAVREEKTDTWQAPFCEGERRYAELGVTVSVLPAGQGKDSGCSAVLCVDLTAEAVAGQRLFWRTYRDGDVIFTHGMHKRLRRLYREAGIPPRMRTRIPLLCDAEGIVWAPFAARRDDIQANGEAPYIIRVTPDGIADESTLKTKDV